MTLAASCANPWPDALAIVGVVWAFAACYIAWRLTGGRHLGERRDRDDG